MSKNTGGSAFPWNDGDVHTEGMTMRQYYKAAAFNALYGPFCDRLAGLIVKDGYHP